jgi:hypothetical protein
VGAPKGPVLIEPLIFKDIVSAMERSRSEPVECIHLVEEIYDQL